MEKWGFIKEKVVFPEIFIHILSLYHNPSLNKQCATVLTGAFQTIKKIISHFVLFFLTSTPRSRRYLTTLIIPLDAAACKGVYDFLSLHVTSAVWVTSNFTTSIWPKIIKTNKMKHHVFINQHRFANLIQLL